MKDALRLRTGIARRLAISIAAAGVTTLAGVLAAADQTQPPPDNARREALVRSAWTRGSDRFERRWLVIGPVPAGPVSERLERELVPDGGEPIRPSPGATASAGSTPMRWMPQASYSDAIDLRGLSASRTGDEYAYAFAVVAREREGDALLSIGSDGALKVWVNGRVAHEHTGRRGFASDTDSVPVRLRAGDNHLLLRLARTVGPWRFTLRVLEPGAILTADEIAPFVERVTRDELTLRTHSRADAGAAVRVEVVSAGGRTLARGDAPRGEAVKFAAAEWPDGAYELRCSTETAWGTPYVAHVPFYRGDAVAAARRLIEAARSATPDADGNHVRMLAALALDRLGSADGTSHESVWPDLHAPLLEFEELQHARSGGAGGVRPSGFVRLAYLDDVDGSTQFCRAYLPPGYASERKWPVVVALHGYNPPNPPYIRWWSVDKRHDPMPDRHGVILLEPHGRGNAQYLGIGERDVLRCMDEAARRFSVDEDRTYLMGDSMGGSGTWIVASRNPDRFAAIAPIFGGWDFRLLNPGPFPLPSVDLTPPERFDRESRSSFVAAESLLNVPIFVHHGDEDPTVSVEHSRHVVRMLQRWGYDVRYEEHPGRTHENLSAHDRIVEWLLQHRRVAAPRQIRLRSPDLAAAKAYWLRVESREDPFEMIRVDAQVVAPGLIRLDTSNVLDVSLAPPSALRGPDGRVHVSWNGRLHEMAAGTDAVISLSSSDGSASSVRKRPGLEGGIQSVMTGPFAIVVGTISSDRLMRQRCVDKANAFADLWTAWQGHRPRVLRDDEITPADERRYSLVLIGGPDANGVSRRLAPQLPVTIAADAIAVDGRPIPARDAVLQMIYPSPSNAERYVVLIAPTSAAGLHFWSPVWFHPALGFPMAPWDWSIHDGRRVALEPGVGPHRAWVAAGMFDRGWRRDDRFVFLGDADLRARSPLRVAPASEVALTEAALERYAGQYEIAPGAVITIVRTGRTLVVDVPPLPRSELIAETETEFSARTTGAPVVFVRDVHGRVTGLVVLDEGREVPAKKLVTALPTASR